MILEKINESFIYYNPNHDLLIGEYYLHCLNILKSFLKKNEENLNIILGDYQTIFENSNRVIKIGFQIEHVIVKKRVNLTPNKFFNTLSKYNNFEYIVRIDNFNYLNTFDYIIEYSLPNINHIKTITNNHLLNNYLNKNIHLFCNLYEKNLTKGERNLIITTFYSLSNRRELLYNNFKNNNLGVTNINECFNKECLTDVFKKTKILINIHQTDNYDTPEELRILPALMSGIIVIAEDSPLKETLPYHEYVIWEKIENIPQKVKEVNENYDIYFEKIFGRGDLDNLLFSMDEQNLKNVFEKIK